jgi:hypothetical protein
MAAYPEDAPPCRISVPKSSGLETPLVSLNSLDLQLFTAAALMRFLERRLRVPTTVLDNRLSCIIMLNTWPIVALAAIVLYRNIIRSFLPGAKVKLTISGVTVEQLSRQPSTQ